MKKSKGNAKAKESDEEKKEKLGKESKRKLSNLAKGNMPPRESWTKSEANLLIYILVQKTHRGKYYHIVSKIVQIFVLTKIKLFYA